MAIPLLDIQSFGYAVISLRICMCSCPAISGKILFPYSHSPHLGLLLVQIPYLIFHNYSQVFRGSSCINVCCIRDKHSEAVVINFPNAETL